MSYYKYLDDQIQQREDAKNAGDRGMMKCKLCGFVAADRSRAGSMQLHALRKHGEKNYLSLFQEIHEEKNENARGSAPKSEKREGGSKKRPNNDHWRLLNPKIAEEKAAIREGFVEINALPGIDSAEWEVR